MEMKLTSQRGATTVQLIGQLWEHQDFTSFLHAVGDIIDQGRPRIVVDLSRLTFVSSQGLGAFVKTYSRARDASCDLVLYRPLGSVREVMELAGFDSFMHIVESVEELDKLLLPPD
jgi:anti-sigma B factor antagonist